MKRPRGRPPIAPRMREVLTLLERLDNGDLDRIERACIGIQQKRIQRRLSEIAAIKRKLRS